jgi:hypothetical protein
MPGKKALSKRKTRAKPAGKKRAMGKSSFGKTGSAGKGEGRTAVQAWIATRKAEHREIIGQLDALITESIPGAVQAVKWSAPFYGLPGKGWLVTVGSFNEYVSVGFFAGTKLKPKPPLGDKGNMRRFQIHDASEYDEARLRSWLQQAAKVQGWGNV